MNAEQKHFLTSLEKNGSFYGIPFSVLVYALMGKFNVNAHEAGLILANYIKGE